MKTGSCLCGSVTYEVWGSLRPIVACHCIQCRKTSGHYVAATQTESSHISIKGNSLKWFRSSERAERAFCSNCGSNLFWRRPDSQHISIFAGTIDGATELKMESQLYTKMAGDYYAIPDVPCIEQSTLK
ncbi:aldehyde-activating protein [Labrys miyagiensis]|uniref:Aldehyde-activating protein n=1 Tax=Labrys miyagiensis TaxID=346912 RepID=A0ABQ6CK18_9HYPH|nr:GFA family protein [Labrys miyagiensis]GLS20089.1 aldehyde-activating protein [Labrys miyagiensis]